MCGRAGRAGETPENFLVVGAGRSPAAALWKGRSAGCHPPVSLSLFRVLFLKRKYSLSVLEEQFVHLSLLMSLQMMLFVEKVEIYP